MPNSIQKKAEEVPGYVYATCLFWVLVALPLLVSRRRTRYQIIDLGEIYRLVVLAGFRAPDWPSRRVSKIFVWISLGAFGARASALARLSPVLKYSSRQGLSNGGISVSIGVLFKIDWVFFYPTVKDIMREIPEYIPMNIPSKEGKPRNIDISIY